jgi:Glyoxalase/Bleomycin resistance protein/Dioxygenase superfamily
MQALDLTALAAERARLRAAYLRTDAERTPTTTRGVHHVALLCANVERTLQFYQGLLEFPLTDVFENRDYKGSTPD